MVAGGSLSRCVVVTRRRAEDIIVGDQCVNEVGDVYDGQCRRYSETQSLIANRGLRDRYSPAFCQMKQRGKWQRDHGDAEEARQTAGACAVERLSVPSPPTDDDRESGS